MSAEALLKSRVAAFFVTAMSQSQRYRSLGNDIDISSPQSARQL